MTAISYHDTVNDLQGLPLGGKGPFARLDWFSLLERSGARPEIALARDGEEAVALPLTRIGHHLHSLTNWYSFTWAELATCHPDRERLLAHLARHLPSRASCVVLDKVPDEDGAASRLQDAFRSSGWFVVRERSDTNHILDIGGRTCAEYLKQRPGPLRSTLKRKGRKVDVDIIDRFQSDAWQSYEDVYEESWKPDEGDRALLRRFAEEEGKAGRLRLGLARHGAAVVAAQFWTVEDRTAWIHKLAHRESARPLSAGTTLTAALFEHVIDRDEVTRIDFGTGDDSYKRDWMEQVRPRYRLTCWQPARPANWPAMAKAMLRQLVSNGAGE